MNSSDTTTIDIPQESPSKKVLMGDIFPEGKTELPVQEFLRWSRAKAIIERKLPQKKEETETINDRILSYLQDSVTPASGNDIVEKLQMKFKEECSVVQKKIRERANIALSMELNKPSLAELNAVNKETDISESILAELEPFILTLMNVNTQCFRFEVHDLNSPSSHILRNNALHTLKKRFIETIGKEGKLSELSKNFFIDQLKKAYWRVHPNHPVHGFLGTILSEVSEMPNYFHNTSHWFGFGADLNEEYLAKLPSENTGNRFWFSKVSAPRLDKKINFRMNTLLFSTYEWSMNAIDEDNWFWKKCRNGTTFSDNAGSYSCFIDACSHIETVGKSEEWKKKEKEPGEMDEYLWPIAYSYGNNSFRGSPGISGGFRFGEFDTCFFEAEWMVFKTHSRIEQALWGSICSGCSRHSFVHSGAEIMPKEIRNGSFDYSVIKCGFPRTTVMDSLRNSILMPLKNSDQIGEGMIIPAYNEKWEKNTALDNSIAIGTGGNNCFFKMEAKGGLEETVFIYAANQAILEENAGKWSLWYYSGCGAKVRGSALLFAKVDGKSFSGPGTEISGSSFCGAKISGNFAESASIWGNPFVAHEYRKSDGHTSYYIHKIIEGQARLMVNDIRSNVVTRNDILHNAICSIPFDRGEWNLVISSEDASRIQARLKVLLSESFSESAEEKHMRKIYAEWLAMGERDLIIEVNKSMERKEWKKNFKKIRTNPQVAVKELEQFPTEKILEEIKHWTSDYGDSLGVSEEIARYVIWKIQEKIRENPIISSEETKSNILIALIQEYLKIVPDTPSSHPLQNAQYGLMADDFWRWTLPGFVWEIEAENIRKEHLRAGKKK